MLPSNSLSFGVRDRIVRPPLWSVCAPRTMRMCFRTSVSATEKQNQPNGIAKCIAMMWRRRYQSDNRRGKEMTKRNWEENDSGKKWKWNWNGYVWFENLIISSLTIMFWLLLLRLCGCVCIVVIFNISYVTSGQWGKRETTNRKVTTTCVNYFHTCDRAHDVQVW